MVQRIRESNLNKGGGERPPQVDPAFELGQTVRVRNRHPKDHTRCPRYVRRATGIVDRVHGTSELPDAKVKGERQLEPLYSVRFESTELWGDDHPESHDVTLNLWESYLTEP